MLMKATTAHQKTTKCLDAQGKHQLEIQMLSAGQGLTSFLETSLLVLLASSALNYNNMTLY